MNKYFCLAAADLHGNIDQYEKIKNFVINEKISFVFFAGDLLPKKGGYWYLGNKIRTIESQKKFIKDYFIQYLKDLSKHAFVYAIFGNDDFKSNFILLKNINKKIFFLDKEAVKLPIKEEKAYVVGYPYVGLTPFLQKDWEKWDSKQKNIDYKNYEVEGYISQGKNHIKVDFSKSNNKHSTIADDLELIAQKSDPQKSIYLMHEAPYNTPLDVIAKDNKFIKDNSVHIGSKAIREFIKKKQPLLTIHGHIHETFAESGEYMWRCNDSISITPSNNFLDEKVSFNFFTLSKCAHITRISL